MATGKLTPGAIFFNFFVGQAVIVRCDLGLVVFQGLFTGFVAQNFVQDRRLGTHAAAFRFLFKISEALRRECKRASLLAC